MMSRTALMSFVLGVCLTAFASNVASAHIHKHKPASRLAATQAALKRVGKHVDEAIASALTIVSKKPNDAPDFDYQNRIAEARALLAKQPVLKDDLQIDARAPSPILTGS